MKVQVAGGDNRVIDPGMYRVRCTAVVAEEAPNDAFGKTKKFRVVLKTTDVVDPDTAEGIELERTVNRAYTSVPKKSNLYMIFEAFGLPVTDQAYEPDTDDLLGKEANAVVIDYVSERDGGQWSRVENLLPLPKVKGNGKSAPSAAQEARQPPEGAAVDADTVRPSIANFAGDVDWTKFWAAADGICGNHDKARAAVAAQFDGDLKPLETMELSLVMDLLEVLRG